MVQKIKQSGQGIKSFLIDLQAHLAQELLRAMEAQLEADVTEWLYREHHARKVQVKRQSRAICQRCGCHEASHFMRNGHRRRQ